MISYLVLNCGTLEELIKEVNRKLAEGWRLQGSIAVISEVAGLIFLQAIVREATGKGRTTFLFERADNCRLPTRPD